MTDRVIDVADAGARFRLLDGRIVVATAGAPDLEVPIAEIAVVVVSHPEVTFTQPVLAALASEAVPLIVCDRKHLPVGMMMPLQAHYAQARRFAAQAAAPKPLRKQAWRQVVRAKILAQASLLSALTGSDEGLRFMAASVKSGDPSNVEAQAARRYWPAVFQDPAFRRDRDAEDQNRLLNYGYAVVRAIVARAVCSAGLHPALGIQHHNRSDAFCLADDLMEPLRPVVDRSVVEIVRQRGTRAPLDRESKQLLLGDLTRHHEFDREQRTLFDWAHRASSSLVNVIEGTGRQLVLPLVEAS